MTFKKRDPKRQERYEMFLSGVQKKEDAAILACLPRVQSQMTEAVNKLQTAIESGFDNTENAIRRVENWHNRSLPRLRDLYKRTLQAQRAKDGRAAVTVIEDFVSECNGWCMRQDFHFVVKRETKNDSRTWDHRATRIDSIDIVTEPKTPYTPQV